MWTGVSVALAEPGVAYATAERQPLPLPAGTSTVGAPLRGTASGMTAAMVVAAAPTVAALWLLQCVVAGAAAHACWKGLVRTEGREASDICHASLADEAGSPAEEPSGQGAG